MRIWLSLYRRPPKINACNFSCLLCSSGYDCSPGSFALSVHTIRPHSLIIHALVRVFRALSLSTTLHREKHKSHHCGIISLPLTFLLTGGIRAVSLVGLTQLAVACKEKDTFVTGHSNPILYIFAEVCCCDVDVTVSSMKIKRRHTRCFMVMSGPLPYHTDMCSGFDQLWLYLLTIIYLNQWFSTFLGQSSPIRFSGPLQLRQIKCGLNIFLECWWVVC